VILPDTNKSAALSIAERLRKQINALKLPHAASPMGFLTISIGVATLDCESIFSEDKPQHMIASALIGKADTALYAAKKQGRNRVVAAETHAG
jgi:diguanylate cyclase (GGDEF)-like protein